MFTQDEMRDELRTIFLFQADNILLGSGEERATAFIGFTPGDDGEYCFKGASLVDLADRPIAGSFERGYDYAFRPSLLNTIGEEDVHELGVFMQGTPRAGGISSGGETHRFMTPDGLCQTVADAVLARWKLEWDAGGRAGHEFTPRELALLANMTEGAVRNATSDKGDGGLKAIPGTKNPVRFSSQEAWRWLSERRGFIPSPARAADDRFLSDQIRAAETNERFCALINRLFIDRSNTINKRLSERGWSADEADRWRDGSFCFDARRARELAEILELDLPLFIGKALEVSLRRDEVRTGAPR